MTPDDELEPESESVAGTLDAIAGAWERAEVGRGQARDGDTVALADL